MQRNAPRSAFVALPDAADAVWFGPNRMTIRARAADTDGAYGLVEAWAPAGSGPPLHVHHGVDEAFWILEGELTIRCGDDDFRAGPGTFALLPRDVPHTFVVEGERDVRLLNLLSPGGSETFFSDAGRPATAAGLPPAGPPDIAALGRAGAEHGIEILGPPMRPRG